MRKVQHKYEYIISNEFEYLDILEGKKGFIYVPRENLLQKGDIIKITEPRNDLELLVKITYIDYSLMLDDFVCIAISEYKD